MHVTRDTARQIVDHDQPQRVRTVCKHLCVKLTEQRIRFGPGVLIDDQRRAERIGIVPDAVAHLKTVEFRHDDCAAQFDHALYR